MMSPQMQRLPLPALQIPQNPYAAFRQTESFQQLGLEGFVIIYLFGW